MEEQQSKEQQGSTGPVTIDDVRQALGDTPPGDTNANRLRAILGRGSFGTIQKHLDALRAQRIAAAQPSTEQTVPKAPVEAIEMLWAAAWGAAQTKTLARLESLSAERDGLLLRSQSQAADIASLTEQLDTLDASFQLQAEALKVAQETALAEVKSAQERLQAESDELVKVRAALAKAQDEAAHAAALAARDAQIERQTMQTTIERLTEQLSESKALHMVAAMQSASPAVQPPVAPAPQPQPTGKEKK